MVKQEIIKGMGKAKSPPPQRVKQCSPIAKRNLINRIPASPPVKKTLDNSKSGAKQDLDGERSQLTPRNQRKKWSRPGDEEPPSVRESVDAAEGLDMDANQGKCGTGKGDRNGTGLILLPAEDQN